MAHKIAKINVLLKNTVYHYKTYQHLKQNGLNQQLSVYTGLYIIKHVSLQ